MTPRFWKRWSGQGTQRKTEARRSLARYARPWFEVLEDRVMLDANLPPAIVVGRTLSAYTVPDVHNHEIAITYTVYNEQANPVTGVLLTDSLLPGVTFKSATQLPDRDGQNLAWSLGTIDGYSRASVTLTVSLPESTPLQIDTGAHAFATLNAGMVTDDTPAAALRPGAVAPELLSSTPDANTTDPFIQEKAAALDYDPQKIFAFLHDEVGYESYVGSLRGARGTLWSSAGNALDVASLGVSLMRASGIPAQYQAGTLSLSQAQELILSMFPASYQTVGYIPAGTEVADPANDPQLLSETESHYWFQFDAGSGMQDADPLMAGATIGQTFTTATGTFSEVADNLRQKTEVKLIAELYYPGFAGVISALNSLSGATGIPGTSQQVVLDQTFNDVDLVGRPLTIGHFVDLTSVPAAFSPVVNTYSPYIEVGDVAFPDPSQDQIIRGTSYQEILTGLPFGEQIITGVFLDISLSGMQQPLKTYAHTLLDRIGYATREGAGSHVTLAVDPTGSPAISNFDLISINLFPSQFNPRSLAADIHMLQAVENQRRVLAEFMSSVESAAEKAAYNEQVNALARDFLVLSERAQLDVTASISDAYTREFARLSRVRAYFDTPRIAIATTTLDNGLTPSSVVLNRKMDLIKDDIRVLLPAGQGANALLGFNGARGIADNAAETEALSLLTQQEDPSPTSTLSIFKEAIDQGVKIITVLDVADVATLQISDDAKARISDAVIQGRIVFVPEQAVLVDGKPAIGWYEVKPLTGELIGVLENGDHGSNLPKAGAGIAEETAVQQLARYLERELFRDGAFAQGFALGTFVILIIRFNPWYFGTGLPSADVSTASLKVLALGFQTSGILEKVVESAQLALFKAYVERPFTFLPDSPQSMLIRAEAGFQLAIAVGLTAIAKDPPLPLGTIASPATIGLPLSCIGSGDIGQQSTLPSGVINAIIESTRNSVTGSMSSIWNSKVVTNFLADRFALENGEVTSNRGEVGQGIITLKNTTNVALTIAGENNYSIQGVGSLSFYGSAENNLGVSGNWDNYTATVTGDVSITLTTDSLRLNGELLPAGTYTITTSAATLSGSGQTSSPNFSGAVAISATDSTISLGAGSGALSVGGKALDPSNGVTLSGYNGSISVVAGGGSDLDAVTLNGNAANVLTVSATPSAFTTDQNTPITIQTNINTSFADTYTLTAQAPTGWTVSIDDKGKVTATPAPGLQSGVFPIQIVAQSTIHPELVAQTTVNVTITPTLPGITLAVNPDPLFTVPYQGAQLPTAFQAVIHNDGPSADTFNLTFSDVPQGFTILRSSESVTIPAGETGIVGVYLQPDGIHQLPPPGTDASFTVTATSASDPGITRTTSVAFVVPEVHGVTVTSTPIALNTTPGESVTATLTLTDVGNVPETVNLSTTLPSGLTGSTLSPVSLAVGQTVTQTITLTPTESAVLNSTMNTTVTASYGPVASPVTQTVQIPVRLVVPGADALANLSVSAQRLGNTDLANRLSDLATAVTNLVQHPESAIYRSQALGNIDSIRSMLASDPFQNVFSPGLAEARAGLEAANSSAEIYEAVRRLGTALDTLDTTLADEIAHRFTLSLSSNSAVVQPGVSSDFDINLQNTGASTTTYDLSVSGLPANVIATFSQTSITLNPGEYLPNGSNRLTLSLTETGNSLVPLGFTVTATAHDAPEITRAVTGELTLRSTFVAVTEVDPNPTFTDPGGLVHVSAKVLNVVNQVQQALVSYTVVDATGHTVYTSSGVPITLGLQASLATVDLGTLNTTGFARGSYTLDVTVADESGTPLPGSIGTGTLLIGSPVTASLTVSPATLPPGNGVVTNTLQVSSQLLGAEPLTLDGQVQTTAVSSTVAIYGHLAYVAGNHGIDIVDISVPSNPRVLSTFGKDLISANRPTIVRVDGTRLIVGTPTNNGQLSVLIYSVATDPLNPELLGSKTFNYAFLQDLIVQGNTVLVMTAATFNGVQHGTVLSIDISYPYAPQLTSVLFNNEGPAAGGDTFQLGGTFVNNRIAYIASTTATGNDFQTGVGRVLVVDYSNPAKLSLLGEVDIPATLQVKDIVIQGNRALVVGSTHGPGMTRNLTLSVLDISDPSHPKLLGTTLVTPGVLPTDFIQVSAESLENGLFAVGQALVNDNPVLYLVDARDPSNIVVTSTSVPAVFNDMAVVGNRLYATSAAGLGIYTVNTVLPPPLTLAGTASTANPGDEVAVYGSLAYVATNKDINIVDVSDPTDPTVVGSFGSNVLTTNTYNIDQVTGHYLLVASGFTVNAGNFHLLIYDLTDALHPALVSNTAINYPFYRGMAIQGNTVYFPIASITFDNFSHQISAQNGDVVAVDISDPTTPQVADVLLNPASGLGGQYNVNGAAVVNDQVAYAVSTTSTGGDTQKGVGRVLVINTTDPTNLSLFGTLDIPGTVQLQGIAIQGNRALVVGSSGGWQSPFTPGVNDGLSGHTTLTVLDITNPQMPQILGSTLVTENQYPLGSPTIKMDVLDLGNGLFAASNNSLEGKTTILLVDVSDPDNIQTGSVQTASLVQGITVSDGFLYAATQDGLSIYHIGSVLGIPVTASVQIPKNTGVDVVANSFNDPPTQIISGTDFDTLIWKRSLGYGSTALTFTWQEALTNLQPGEARPTTGAGTVTFVSQGTSGSIPLAPTVVSSAQILELSPASQTVHPAEPAEFLLKLDNPTASSITYTLSAQGLPANWVTLAPSVTVAAHQSETVSLTLSSDSFAALGDYGFAITAVANTGFIGSVQGSLTLVGTPAVQPDPQAHGIVVDLIPSAASAGQGTSTNFTVRLTNTGSSQDTFDLSLQLPAGVQGTFSQPRITIAPGVSNFREVQLTLTPARGTPPGEVPFTVEATSTTRPSVGAVVGGTLTILNTGVAVALDRSSLVPGSSLQMTVTNTGKVTDTFDLSLAGPAALVAHLATSSVTLAPGASQTVAIRTDSLSFAVPGNLSLLAVATSHTNAQVFDAANANLTIAETTGMTAEATPSVQILPVPGTTSFLVLVHNLGNVEDAYSATIAAIRGPASATLLGLDGLPTSSIPVFRLPGLASGALLLQVNLPTDGTGHVTLQLQSLRDGSQPITLQFTVSVPPVVTSVDTSVSLALNDPFLAPAAVETAFTSTNVSASLTLAQSQSITIVPSSSSGSGGGGGSSAQATEPTSTAVAEATTAPTHEFVAALGGDDEILSGAEEVDPFWPWLEPEVKPESRLNQAVAVPERIRPERERIPPTAVLLPVERELERDLQPQAVDQVFESLAGDATSADKGVAEAFLPLPAEEVACAEDDAIPEPAALVAVMIGASTLIRSDEERKGRCARRAPLPARFWEAWDGDCN